MSACSKYTIINNKFQGTDFMDRIEFCLFFNQYLSLSFTHFLIL